MPPPPTKLNAPADTMLTPFDGRGCPYNARDDLQPDDQLVDRPRDPDPLGWRTACPAGSRLHPVLRRLDMRHPASALDGPRRPPRGPAPPRSNATRRQRRAARSVLIPPQLPTGSRE